MLLKVALALLASIALVAADHDDEDNGMEVLRMGKKMTSFPVFRFSSHHIFLCLGRRQIEYMDSMLYFQAVLYCRDVNASESMENMVMNEIYENYTMSDAFEIPDGLQSGMPFAPVSTTPLDLDHLILSKISTVTALL